jgi:SPP1 family predicted phage head-tail adaptor
MRAGNLRTRCEFQKPVENESPTGNVQKGWALYKTVWGDLLSRGGREQLAAGRLQSEVPGTLQVRWSTEMDQVTADFRVLINGKPYQIISAADRDMRRRTIDFVVMAGAASA